MADKNLATSRVRLGNRCQIEQQHRDRDRPGGPDRTDGDDDADRRKPFDAAATIRTSTNGLENNNAIR